MSGFSNEIKGKVALITGAGSGIGQAIAVGLSSQGAKVVLVGRRAAKLEETADLIKDKGGNVFTFTADVANNDDVEAMASKVLSQIGVPSVLVNGAGVFNEIGTILNSNPLNWIETLIINTAGPYLVCRAFAGEMVKQGWGRIINITSAASLAQPEGGNSAYATSKVALNHFTRQLAAELTGTGVTANVFHPGEVKTEMFTAIRDNVTLTDELEEWVALMERTGGDSPEKSVKLVVDLMNRESDSINGRFLWIDGGLKKPMQSWD